MSAPRTQHLRSRSMVQMKGECVADPSRSEASLFGLSLQRSVKRKKEIKEHKHPSPGNLWKSGKRPVRPLSGTFPTASCTLTSPDWQVSKSRIVASAFHQMSFFWEATIWESTLFFLRERENPQSFGLFFPSMTANHQVLLGLVAWCLSTHSYSSNRSLPWEMGKKRTEWELLLMPLFHNMVPVQYSLVVFHFH